MQLTLHANLHMKHTHTSAHIFYGDYCKATAYIFPVSHPGSYKKINAACGGKKQQPNTTMEEKKEKRKKKLESQKSDFYQICIFVGLHCFGAMGKANVGQGIEV